MRKFILITAMVLVSASAQAGDRSLSLGGAGSLPIAASNSINTSGKSIDTPTASAVEPPPKPPEAPKYVERAAPVAAPAPQPQAGATAQQASVQPSAAPDAGPAVERRTTAHRSSHSRYAGRWTEARIIGELHRHGIYW